jgi:hypothetical protein
LPSWQIFFLRYHKSVSLTYRTLGNSRPGFWGR